MQTLFKRPDLSVIIPVYNLENYLQPMLDSLKAQKLEDYTCEIIFVLNNCTDASEDVIRNSGLPCRIMYCTEQGCGPARNVGYESSEGDYIWFMDGDDYLLSDTAISEVLNAMKSQNLDIMRIPFESDNFKRPFFSMVWQYVFKREFIQDFRFPDYQPAEDDAYMVNVLGKAGYGWLTYLQMPAYTRPLYFYRYLREGSNMYRNIVLKENI